MTTPKQHSQAEYYDAYWSGESGWKPDDRVDAELCRWLEPIASTGKRILDAGCGDGSRYAAHLLKAGVDLHGTDISDRAVLKAISQGVNARVASLDARLPFDDSEFDGAICLEVLEHLVDPAYAALELFRVLRPGGMLVASVPNTASWRNRIEFALLGHFNPGGSPMTARYYPWRDPHLRFFNMWSFAAMLAEAGFRIQRRGGLDVQFLSSAPLLRAVMHWRILYPARVLVEMLGRLWPSLLAGRCVLQATKPNPDR